MVQYFISMIFAQNYLQFKKIDSFRRRFDPKYRHSPLLQLTLVPPFSIPRQDLHDLLDALEEEMDSHLNGIEEAEQVLFEGVGIEGGRSNLIYLMPHISSELFHCQEALIELCVRAGAQFKKGVLDGQKSLRQQKLLLPIGRLPDHLVHSALEKAKMEFEGPMFLKARHFALFEKNPGQWIQRRKLFHFGDTLAQPSLDSRDYANHQSELFNP